MEKDDITILNILMPLNNQDIIKFIADNSNIPIIY